MIGSLTITLQTGKNIYLLILVYTFENIYSGNCKVRNWEVGNLQVRNCEVRNCKVRNCQVRNCKVRNCTVWNCKVRNIRLGIVRLFCLLSGLP